MSADSESKWFHVILTMYGAWLPGDKRGFRTRKHREHVEGDYKNPPRPGQYEGLAHHSRGSLQRAAAAISLEQRKIVGLSLRDTLLESDAVVACLSVSAKHAHLLVKLPPAETRHLVGIAKKDAWFKLRETGCERKLWAKRPKFIPVRDRSHQLNVYNYILEHAREGAWVWKHSDGLETESSNE